MAHPGSRADDDSILDDLFDSVSASIERGEEPEIEELLAAHPHLADEIADMAKLAADVAVVLPSSVPSIPGYEIVRELGRGGMGAVYLAKQTSLGGRLVALKVLPHGAALSAQALTRFRHEARALARVRHPNVIEIFDVLDLEGVAAYAMEWIDGCSLLDIIERIGVHRDGRQTAALSQFLDVPLTDDLADVAARWGAEIADALAEVHREGLLHRDVKPSNIMIRRDGTALLTDFGLARAEDSSLMTRTGAFLGTPAYAAPEQLRGGDIDARTDVCGLGVTLYHALCGVVPYEGASNVDVLRRIERGQFHPVRKRNARIPVDLATVVETAMDAEPELRYESADELRADLLRFVAREPIRARPAGLFTRMHKYARRNRSGVFGAAVGGVVALVLAFALAGYLIHRAGIPVRFDDHVRRAHVGLLDPSFAEMIVTSRHARVSGPSDLPIDAVLSEYDAALALREDREVRMARETLALARFLVAGEGAEPKALARDAPVTFAVAQQWGETGEIPRATDFDVRSATAADRRCLGLLAVVCGAPRLGIEAWQGLDLAEPPDQLVDAALGQLYLQRGEPAFAWPRLERVVPHFSEAGFLRVALAESALKCGDAAYAERLLRNPERIENVDKYRTLERVRADALWRLGRKREARKIYSVFLGHNVSPMTAASLARYFADEGDFARAAQYRWRIMVRWARTPGAAEGLGRTLARWWKSLDPVGRRNLLRSSLATPGSFLDYLACWARRAEDRSRHRELAALAAKLPLGDGELAGLRRLGSWFHEAQVRAWLAPLPLLDRCLDQVRSVGEAGAGAAAWFARRVASRHAPVWESIAVGGADAVQPSISASGRYVAFASRKNDVGAVHCMDRWSGEVTTIAASAEGRSDRPGVSGDGRFIAFYSQAPLVEGDRNGDWDCFVWDRETQRVECVSRDDSGRPGGCGELVIREAPEVSARGEWILFRRVTSAVEGRPTERLFLRDRVKQHTTQVVIPPRVLRPREMDRTARLAGNGTVLFTSGLVSLVTPDVNLGNSDVLARRRDGSFVRFSECSGRQADFASELETLSACRRWMVLRSSATNLRTVDVPSEQHLFLRDLSRGHVRLLGRVAGIGSDGVGVTTRVATNGWVTAFVSAAGHQRTTRDPKRGQIYSVFTVGRVTEVLSADASGVPGDGESTWPALSRCGVCVFQTRATNLVAGCDGSWNVVAVDLQPLPPGSLRSGAPGAPRVVVHDVPRRGAACHVACHGAPAAKGVLVVKFGAAEQRIAARPTASGVARVAVQVPEDGAGRLVAWFEFGSVRSERVTVPVR